MPKLFFASFAVILSTNVASAASFCFDAKESIGILAADQNSIQINYDFKTNLEMNKLMGWTQEYSENNGVITVKAYLDSRVSDGFTATVVVTSRKITLKENARVLATYKIVRCPLR